MLTLSNIPEVCYWRQLKRPFWAKSSIHTAFWIWPELVSKPSKFSQSFRIMTEKFKLFGGCRYLILSTFLFCYQCYKYAIKIYCWSLLCQCCTYGCQFFFRSLLLVFLQIITVGFLFLLLLAGIYQYFISSKLEKRSSEFSVLARNRKCQIYNELTAWRLIN